MARSLKGMLQRLVGRVALVQVLHGQSRPAGGGSERVVEIVGDATGEPAKCLGLLALHQVLLQGFLARMGSLLCLCV